MMSEHRDGNGAEMSRRTVDQLVGRQTGRHAGNRIALPILCVMGKDSPPRLSISLGVIL